MPLYHKQVHGLPILHLSRLTSLELTLHAVERAIQRGAKIDVLSVFDPVTCPVFQIETCPNISGGQSIIKLNYRKRLDSQLDYCVCLNPIERRVLSCWVQWRTFQPFINRSAYDRPPSGLVLSA